MKNMSRMAAIALLTLPFFTSAQTVADLQAQTQLLMQQIVQLQAQLAAMNGGVPTPTGTPIPGGTGASCPNIGRSLKPGTTGEDVSRLQQFLARDPSVYPEATVSGYYGPLTQTAVQRFQVKFNIVSGGSPATNGYGVVGPRTAAAIARVCSGTPTPTPTPGPSQVGGYIQVSPISGNAPLTVQIVANVNTTKSCTGATYAVDYGDGATPSILPVPAGTCEQISQTYSHVYQYGGTYQVKLSAEGHETTTMIAVTGPAAPTGTPGIVASTSDRTLTASPMTGSAPLSVTFVGVVPASDSQNCSSDCTDVITFGDGSNGIIPLPANATVAQSFTITHSYTNPGTYTAQLRIGNASAPVTKQVTIVVAVPVVPPGSGSGNGSYGIISVTPGTGLSIDMQIALPACPTTHSVDWGDGVVNPNAAGSATCVTGATPSTQTYSHTFANAGNYTIKLKDGSGVVQASASISISN